MAWNDGLSEEQIRAASCCGQHTRLLAGPGTGKTKCLTAHAAFLAEERGVRPQDILLVTFTRAAAAHMRSEIEGLFGAATEKPRAMTLHSFALQTILRHPTRTHLPQPVRIADDYEERWIILEDLKAILELPGVDDARDRLNQLSADWERLTAQRADWEERFPDPRFLGAWREHRAVFGYTLRAELVYQLKTALASGELAIDDAPRHLLLDEYQDLNPCDLAVVAELAREGAELFCGGDDDQSIYGFRYADPTGIRRFPDDYRPNELVELQECRRCCQRVLDYALFVADQDTRRLAKPIHSVREGAHGDVRVLNFYNQDAEAWGIAELCRWLIESRGVSPEEILVLLRSDDGGRFSQPLERQLALHGVPVAIAADPMRVLDQPDGRRLLSLLRLIDNPDDHLAWRTVLKLSRGVGQVALDRLYEHARNAGVGFAHAIHQTAGGNAGGRLSRPAQEVYDSVQECLAEVGDAGHADVMALVTDLAERAIEDLDRRAAVLDLIRGVAERAEADTLPALLRSLATALGRLEQDRPADTVSIMTMHQAKGLSADAVIIAAAEDEYIPGRAQGSEVDDERRLLYVSLTRARDYLFVTHCSRRTGRQMRSGRNPTTATRTLSSFLRGGPVEPEPGVDFVRAL